MRFAPRGLDKKNQLNILICRIIEPLLLNRMKDASIFFLTGIKGDMCFFLKLSKLEKISRISVRINHTNK